MDRPQVLISAAVLILALLTQQQFSHSQQSKERASVGSSPAVLWRQPQDIKTRNLFFGPGGTQHTPQAPLIFTAEDTHGTQPKFVVRDSKDVRWGVKLGPEARAETAATRILWAVGYFADEEYFVQEMPLAGVPDYPLDPAVPKDGKVIAARMKRHIPHRYKIGYWRWDDNPFTGTRELNGLKVMMELMNNTDFKPVHLVIYDMGGKEQQYMVKDLGATFGRAGAGYFTRTKGVLSDYQRFDLIRHADSKYVDFWYFKHIPRAHAKWIGELAGQLSDKQIRDAFRAGGFTPEDIEGFTRKLREKINELRRL